MGNGLVLLSIFSCFLSSVTNILVCIPSSPSLPNCGSLHVFISVFLWMLIVKHFFLQVFRTLWVSAVGWTRWNFRAKHVIFLCSVFSCEQRKSDNITGGCHWTVHGLRSDVRCHAPHRRTPPDALLPHQLHGGSVKLRGGPQRLVKRLTNGTDWTHLTPWVCSIATHLESTLLHVSIYFEFIYSLAAHRERKSYLPRI